MDAFTDVLDDDGEGSDPPSTTDDQDIQETVTDMGVRTTLPDENVNDNLNEDRYEDPNTDNKADDVDPRSLFRKPDINELRYYYREGPYGGTIVEKPILDAFKHGFEIDNDNTERDNDGQGTIKDFLDEYLPYYFIAEIKARRDGMSVLMFHIGDGADTAAEPVEGEGEHRGFKVWTIDNLTDSLSVAEVSDHTDFDTEQIYISEGKENGGIAVVDDISHPRHDEILGYGVESRKDDTKNQSANFIHADRCQHFVWGEYVDGPINNDLTGKHIGESILTPILQPLKAAQMGFWAIKNILYRYSAPLHAVEPPDTWGTDDFDDAREKMDDLSMASDAVLPPGSELNVAEGTSEFDPEPSYDVLVESMCSGTVFTKSVLEGTQVGTVSGSETDVKGYFNGVQKIRTGRTERKFHEATSMVSSWDPTTVPPVAGPQSFDINWGALFKPTDIEQADGAVSMVSAVSNGIKQYVLTPDEARSILSEEWSEFDIDVDLPELDEEQKDDLDRINLNEAGQGIPDNEPDTEPRQNPQLQNGGGQPAGQTRESSQPTRDSASRQSSASSDDDTEPTRDALEDALAQLDPDERQELLDSLNDDE